MCGQDRGTPSPTAPGLPPTALNPQSPACGGQPHIPGVSASHLYPLVARPQWHWGRVAAPASPWPWQCPGVASARTGAEAQLSAWIFAGILAPANPHVAAQPPSQSRAATWPFLPHAASTNHNQTTLWSDQSCAATWHFPTANHVLPLVCAAASPLAAAAHQSRREGDRVVPIRSCCFPSVPANQGQPHPARSYKAPSAAGLYQQQG